MRIIQISDHQLASEYERLYYEAQKEILTEISRILSDPEEIWDLDVRHNGIKPVIDYVEAWKGQMSYGMD